MEQLNSALIQARENYRVAIDDRRKALELEPSLNGTLDRKKALQSADDQVELAAMRFREALRDFVTVLKRDKT